MFSEGDFSVNKTLIPFSAIGVDHTIEQENRAIKVLGGITGIANNRKALHEYFLQDFCDVFIKQNEAPKRTQHYQLTGSKNERINDNVKKMSDMFCSHEIKFEKFDIVFNVLTKKVLPESLAMEL